MSRNAVESRIGTLRPCLFKLDAGDSGQQIDPIRLDAQLGYHARRAQIRNLNSKAAKPELGEGAQHTRRVFRGGTHQNVEIGGIARIPVKGDRVGANDQVFNSVRVQQLDKLAPISVQRHRGDGVRGVRSLYLDALPVTSRHQCARPPDRQPRSSQRSSPFSPRPYYARAGQPKLSLWCRSDPPLLQPRIIQSPRLRRMENSVLLCQVH